MSAQENKAKILILATEDCAYPGANATGQAHMSYPENTYILRVRAPVMFPEKFYMDCFKKGIYGIIIMSCGVECAYEGAYPALAARIDRLYPMMREAGFTASVWPVVWTLATWQGSKCWLGLNKPPA